MLKRRLPALALAILVAAYAGIQISSVHETSGREYDEGVYLCSARAVADGYALFTEVFSSQPPAFVESLALAMRVAGANIVTGHLFMLSFAVLLLLACADLARRLAGPWAAAAAVLVLGFARMTLELGHIVQAEMPAMAVAVCSLCACLHARRRGWNRAWLVAAGALLALGGMFKLFVAPLVLPLMFLLLLREQRSDEEPWTVDGGGTALAKATLVRTAFVVAGAAVVVAVPLLVYPTREFLTQSFGLHIVKQQEYTHHPLYNAGLLGGQLMKIVGACILGAGGWIRMLSTNRVATAWLVVWMAAAALAILQQTPLFWRHVLLALPPAAVAAGVGAVLLPRLLPAHAWKAGAVASLVLLGASITNRHGLSWSPVREIREATQNHRNGRILHLITAWIEENTYPHDRVAGDDPLAVFLAGRQTPPAVCDTSLARIRVRYLRLKDAARESATAPVVVLHSDGRLMNMAGYREWLTTEYEHVEWSATRAGAERSVWVRKEPLARR